MAAAADRAHAQSWSLVALANILAKQSLTPDAGPTCSQDGKEALMGTVQVIAERVVHAPAEAVYGYIADMREHHHRFLPPAFSDFGVDVRRRRRRHRHPFQAHRRRRHAASTG